jgi:uncharacterized protein (DUF1697 family)
MKAMAPRLIALLRGVNVGGNRLIDMTRLRRALSDRGYGDVRTYLQSGNVVFSSTAAPADAAADVQDTIAGEFGVDCQVIVRTSEELAAAMTADPLLHFLGNPSRHFVAFLDAPAPPEALQQLAESDYGDDQLRAVGNHLYLWCPNGLSKSSFARLNFDRVLGVAVTVRNWNTVTKLAVLAGASP